MEFGCCSGFLGATLVIRVSSPVRYELDELGS